jgi:hypothetical protein
VARGLGLLQVWCDGAPGRPAVPGGPLADADTHLDSYSTVIRACARSAVSSSYPASCRWVPRLSFPRLAPGGRSVPTAA